MPANSRAASAIGVIWAYLRPSRRASPWSACTEGSANCFSSSACSRMSASSEEGVAVSLTEASPRSWCASMMPLDGPDMRTAPAERGRCPLAGAAMPLLGRRLRALASLAEALLEPGHAAAGVEDALLARVERVARGAGVGVDDTVLRGAARLEGVAAGTRDGRLDVLRVNVRLHGSRLSG